MSTTWRISLVVLSVFLGAMGAEAQSVNYTFSHLAGSPVGPDFADGTGSAARLSWPEGSGSTAAATCSWRMR